jgi:hypothetical protein
LGEIAGVKPQHVGVRKDEDSIVILRKGKEASSQSKSNLWRPFVSESIEMLKSEQKSSSRSLGIIKPDINTLKFIAKPIKDSSEETKAIMQSAYDQASLFEESLKPLEKPEFVFSYRFKSDNKQHEMQIHDWEVQATYRNYKKLYGNMERALEKMAEFYDKRILTQHPHFIMGNMKRSPWQFMIIGILRSTETAQSSLFDVL